MAREIILIRERVKPFPLLRPLIETTHIDALKTCIIDRLREAFKVDPEYTYIEDETGSGGPELDPGRNQTQIVITDVYTYDVKFLPAITVRVNSSNTHHVSFNQNGSPLGLDTFTDITAGYSVDPHTGELQRDELGRPKPLFFEYAGAWDSIISLEISAEDTLTREELASRVSILMIHVLRDQLYENGIFVKTVNVSGESEEPYANDYIYRQSISLDVYSEWTHRIPVPDDSIDCFNISFDMVGNDLRTKPIGNAEVLHTVYSFLCKNPSVEPVDCITGETFDITEDQSILEQNPLLDWRVILGTLVGWNGSEFKVTEAMVNFLEREDISIEDIRRAINLADIESRARRAARTARIRAETVRARALVNS